MNSLQNKQIIFLSHVLFIGPLLTYVGFMKTKTHPYVFKALLLTGIIVALYHGYHLYMHYTSSNIINYVNLFHILAIAPLLIYIAHNNGQVVYPMMDLLFILGVGVTILFLLKLSK